MKILHVTNMWPTEDAPHYGSFVKSQVASLEKAGVSCKTVFDNDTKGVKKYLALRARTTELIKEFRPDVIHAHFGWTAAALAPTDIPIVVSFCGGDLNGESGGTLRQAKYALGRQLSILASHKSAFNIVKSEIMLHYLPHAHISKSAVIPNGVDMDLFSDAAKKSARAKLGWGEENIILFAGRPDDPTKNFKLAKLAVEIAKNSIPGLVLKSPIGVKHSDMPLLLNATDVLLITSIKEGSPNIVKEALSCNLPVVGVPVGDLEWLLRGLKCSYICPYDPQTVATAIEKLFGNPCLVNTEGRTRLIEKELDSTSVAKKLIRIYKRASCKRL